MLRLIGVIDLLAGRAVHARGGNRDEYEPVRTAAGEVIGGDPIALASVYVHQLGLRELYVADLDAIRDSRPLAPVVRSLTTLGARVWLDAGVQSGDGVARAVDAGAAHVIVALETLPSYHSLSAICHDATAACVAFSLDLRAGSPVIAAGAEIGCEPVDVMASRAVDCGVDAIVVLDLARVGMRQGPPFGTVEVVRRAVPHVTLVAGGGVRDAGDLARLESLGCDGAVVATALHDGRIDPRQSSVSR
jgi:phosphoribosylformimino-5-aminoimidazole carboxamide ribotide isomerase